MVTFSTLVIMLAIAVANTFVGITGVWRKMEKTKQLWHNDAGVYLPWPFRFLGFYRGGFINIGFAGSALATTCICLRGEPESWSRELIFVVGLADFIGGVFVAIWIPSDFRRQIKRWSADFWKVVVFGVIISVLYFGGGCLMTSYANSLKLTAS